MSTIGLQTDPRDSKFVRAPDGVLLGVCKGLSQAFGLDVVLMRIIWLVALLWFGTGLLFYLLLGVALPRADQLDRAHDSKVLGVCARISERYSVEMGLVRAGFLFFTLMSAVVGGCLLYVVCYLLLPKTRRKPGDS